MQFLTVPYDGKRVGANAIHRRLYDREGNGGGNGSIDCVAAREKHAQTSLRCKGLGCRHGVARQDRAATRGIRQLPVDC